MRHFSFTILLLVLILQVNAQINFTALKMTPDFPQANSMVKFEYNSNFTKLLNQKNIKVAAYVFTGTSQRGYKIVEPELKLNDGIIRGSFKVDSNAAVIAFVFTSDKEKDINNNLGYIFPVYDKQNMPIESYYKWASNIQFPYGQIIFGMDYNAKKGVSILEEAMVRFPESKSKQQFLGQYLYLLNQSPTKENTNIIKTELELFEKKQNLTEQDFKMFIQFYSILKIKDKADSFNVLMKKNYPEGDWFMEEMVNRFLAEQKAILKAQQYKLIVAKYPSIMGIPNSYDDFRAMVANAFAKEGNYKEFDKWNSSLKNSIKANSYNALALFFLKTGEDLPFAKKIADFAANFSKRELQNPTEKKADYITQDEWVKFRRTTYAEHADTYATILQKLGDYEKAFSFAKDAASIEELKNKGYNERYAIIAEKILPKAEVKILLEKFYVEHTASPKLKEILKIFLKSDIKDANDYEAYFSKLKVKSSDNRKLELQKEMLNEMAPDFALKDFEGKEVSLVSLKGKTVVVDFWATWCGPCIASMPAMKKALTKYNSNEQVEFLFVDTWERSENKRQNAIDFMAKNTYPFRVLLDNENRMVTDFNVSGIPTKFVIDRNGKIRFKAMGFEGEDDDLVEELSSMIELAGK